MYRSIQMPAVEDNQVFEWKPPNLGGGLCLTDLEYKLADNQSPRAKNVWYADKVLSKRYGQEMTLASNLGTNPILAIYEKKYKAKVIFTYSTKMYTLDLATKATTEIYSGLTASKGVFFEMNDILYYKNGTDYVQWNGTTASAVTPYIPTVSINRTPTGGGDLLENYNKIGAGFKNKIHGDNTSTAYTLSLTGLDATAVTATVGGVPKAETTDFTVNRTTGVVTFSVAPATGVNNVEITAYKTDATAKNAIYNCKYVTVFGGSNDSRVFVCGNGSGPIFWSGLLDPTYFPDQNYNIFSGNDQDCTGFGKQYDVLIVFKPNSIFRVDYLVTSGVASFPSKMVNSTVGCDMPYSIQVVNNRLTWCNTYGGVYTLASTQEKDEKNVKPLSLNINGTAINSGLLAETNANLILATSVDWANKSQYWLCVGTHVYMWDYGFTPYVDTDDLYEDQKRLSWWYFDNVNANCFFQIGNLLYYGDRTVGNIALFIATFRDFATAIDAYYRIPLRDFGLPTLLKTVRKLAITGRTDTNTEINIKYITNTGDLIDPKPIILSSFSWRSFSWLVFSWQVFRYAKTFDRYPNSKHILYWSVEFSSNSLDRDMSLTDVSVEWVRSKKIR